MPTLHVLLCVSVLLAFIMGFAIVRGDICAVAAVNYWINQKRTAYLRAFIAASASAGLALLPCAWFFQDFVTLSKIHPVSTTTLVGGAFFGLGAFLNGACVFGTIAHISRGETNYLGSIVGMFLGGLSAPFATSNAEVYSTSPLSSPTILAVLVWLAFIGILIHQLFSRHQLIRLNYFKLTAKYEWDPILSMTVIGMTGGVLYGTVGNWGYLTVLSQDAAKLTNPYTPSVATPVLTATSALFLGAIVAAWKMHRLNLRKPEVFKFGQKVIAGMLMSVAATLIPGGNDVLLLYGIPSFAVHALVAYLVMLATLAILFKSRKAR